MKGNWIFNAFFIDTLNIGGKRCHIRFNAEVMECNVWTKEKKKSGISEEDINVVRKNIESFRTVQSDYCRNTTSKNI